MADSSEIKRKAVLKDSSDEDPDVHVCGRCKATFIDLSEYVRHKRNKACRRGLEVEPSVKKLPIKGIMVHVDEEKIQGIKIGRVPVTEMLKSPLSRALPSGPLGPPAKGECPALCQKTSPPPVTIDVAEDKTTTENPRPFPSLLRQRHTITSAQIKPLGEKLKGSKQEQSSCSETDDEEYHEVNTITGHPHISEHGPTVVILDGTELESAQIVPSQKVEVQLIDDERLSPEFGGPLVEVSHDHGYSRPSTPTLTGEKSLPPKKRKRKNSTPKTTRKRKSSATNSTEKSTSRVPIVEVQSQPQSDPDSVLVHIPETQLVHITSTGSSATTSPSSTTRKQVPATSVFVPIYLSNSPKTYRCYKCPAVFNSTEERQEHSKLHKPLFKCNDCTKRFYSSEALESHRTTDTHQYACDQCDKVLPSTAKLARHKVIHVTEKNFMCDVCQKTYRTEQNLRSHKYTVHAAEKKHKCSYCGKAFARKDKLTRHEYIHTPNRPNFVCPFRAHTGCTRTFYREDKLKRHLFTHSKEKPYKCEHCGRGFARRDNLRDHMRTHTGVYTHMCHLCNKGFLAPNKLKKHLQATHGILVEEDSTTPLIPTMVQAQPDTQKPEVQSQSQGPAQILAEMLVATERASQAEQKLKLSAVPAEDKDTEADETREVDQQADEQDDVDVGEENQEKGQEQNQSSSSEENKSSSSGSDSESEVETETMRGTNIPSPEAEPFVPPTVAARKDSNLPSLNSSLPLPPPLLPSSRFQGQHTPELLSIPNELLNMVRGFNS